MSGTATSLCGPPTVICLESRGYQTVFMAKGPDIANKAEILSMCLVDEGPTLARLLGVTLPDADGRVIRQLTGQCHKFP